ncbi:transcriptional regulator, AsnC family [Methylibium petroleiphilum PM1]|uniref:Transcriptional regulator, AsnC family n=1 Tax=Methylibium petroleiphilum (strain ATCC BAA-1232 / LMG 22953 / PM1) TaxID=420662 RepID=A2SHN5_METPP|nr:transcriptional regulator, AsnC family [Methylibium petroleiphilum PM1]
MACACHGELRSSWFSGDSDYLLKVVARDLKSLSQFLTDRLMQISGVANVRSMICMEEIKPPSPLPTTTE